MKLGRFTLAGYAVGLSVGLGLILVYGAVEVSSTPAFCGSCHIMSPYYTSWKTSSHADISCVECHIAPGITSEFRKKYEGLSMVARYFTGTYGTNPWAEVEDSACLECHERRLLIGREVFGDVLFDHGPHLTELRRGKRLRCTSCHSQIVQGSHITVTSTTCTLCHFKGQPPGGGTSECTLCHQVPQRVVDAGGLAFDHSDVSTYGMDCQACHTPPDPTAGGVPRERCLTCHNEPDRLEAYEEVDVLHRTHVTDHKVECTNCHLEIEHVAPHHLEAARTACSACHGGRHSPQRDLYAGIGGKGVPPSPDVMFQAGVRCEGCHANHGDGETSLAGEISCMSCHGPGYRALFHNWQQAMASRTAGVRRLLDDSAPKVNGSPALDDARANLELVERGRGIHNVRYSFALLAAAHRQINEARHDNGLSPVPAPWPTAPYETPCLECHAGVEAAGARAFGRAFPHRPHVVGQGLDCEHCHATHEERDAEAASLKLTASSCDGCHHGGSPSAARCLECHGEIRGRTFDTEFGDFAHQVHAVDMELDCGTCHGPAGSPRPEADRAACADCH